MVNVSNDIPFPGRTTRNGRPAKYPWATMEVGDSFPVELGRLSVVRACADGYGRRHGREYRVEKLPSGEFRCWRIA